MMVNCACPHKGVATKREKTRYVLFLNYYPLHDEIPDTEEQRYPQGILSDEED